MRLIYIVRHASVQVQPDRPARDWPLSERGQREAEAIASAAEGWGIEALYSSSEVKAQATALIIGAALGLPVQPSDAFDELRMPWIANADAFNESVQAILAGEPVRGAEMADAAAARFAAGIEHVAGGPLPAAVVSHGRVITSYLGRRFTVEDQFDYWRSIPMPGWAAVDLDAAASAAPPAFNA